MQILLYITVSLLTAIAWQTLTLLRNYALARRIGLPILISPMSTFNPIWIALYKLLPIIPLLQRLPFELGKWAKYTYLGWQFDDKFTVHRELGSAFVVCSPSSLEINLADPEAVRCVFARWKDFPKASVPLFEPANVFGRNVVTVEGETWRRHRRVTAPSLNEGVSASVWSEATRQASQVLRVWAKAGSSGTRDTTEDALALAMHVLTYAGFGIQCNFAEAPQNLDLQHRLTYHDALVLLVENWLVLEVIPLKLLKYPVLPRSLRRIGDACDEFIRWVKEMVTREKAAAANRSGGDASNLLSALVRASEASSAIADGMGSNVGNRLTDDELYGNLYVHSLAGYENTARTAAAAIMYLAAAPYWQDWIHEEIQEVADQLPPGTQSWAYEDAYPKLKRCLAVMLETMRLHLIPISLPRSNGSTSCTLSIAGRDYYIPPKTTLTINSHGLHCDENTWGHDALEWRPARWIVSSSDPGKEELFEPSPGTFVGFGAGPRICPGKKFSQVQFVATMAVLFRHHHVHPKQENGECEEQAVKRLEEMIDDSGIPTLTLQMRRPRDVALVWTERGAAR